MKRHLLALALLAVLTGMAGCGSIFGPGDPDPERLNESATYDWETNATVSITINRSSYQAVYNVSNRSELEAYRRDALGRDRYVPISALQYRYENGTIVTHGHGTLSVEQTRQRTILSLPNGSDGQVAFTAPRHGKSFATPVFVEGSYEVTLPPDGRVGIPLLSQVSPGGYQTNVSDDRMTIHWDDVTTRSVSVRYYLERDVYLFSAVVIVACIVGGAGAAYYYRQIQQLAKRREIDGVALEAEDEGDRGDESDGGDETDSGEETDDGNENDDEFGR